MTDTDDEFLKRLLVTFAVEAQEHLQGICSGLLRLEKSDVTAAGHTELVETMFREVHSLKGAARAVNQVEIESLCQALETVFSALKKTTLTTSPALFDLLQEVVDFLVRVLPDLAAERTQNDKSVRRQLINRLEEAVKGTTISKGTVPVLPVPQEEAPCAPAAIPQTPQIMPNTVRVSTARLTSVLLQSEEMLSAKLAASQRVLDMRAAGSAFGTWEKKWSRVRPLVQALKKTRSMNTGSEQERGDANRQRSVTEIMDFLAWNADFITSFATRFSAEVKAAERDDRALGGMVTSLLDDVKAILMFPFSSLLEILPKIVRDLCRDNGKKIELTISGDEIEIDRRILDEIKDPLLHLVRNCIDHGIENAAERIAKGKPPFGTIRVAVLPMDDKVELTVSDDGCGISPEAIRSALLKLGTVSEDTVAGLGNQELLAHIFQSGVTTNPIITEISGRGLGLAIVRENVEKTGGTVSVESVSGSGTTFRIVLPLTVATFRGILVRINEHLFVFPAMHVSRVLRVTPDEIRTVENRETISLDGEAVSLARLATVLELSAPRTLPGASALLSVVILAASGIRIAFQVDEVVGEQEVLVKGLGCQLSRVRNVAGATLLGNGRIAPILNVTDLLKSAINSAASSPLPSRDDATGNGTDQARAVLVAEDSITTRTLLKNILESAGYAVTTAVDGRDALTMLARGTFDIVVSDVEMPRMNGFELTASIRADTRLAELPVVLITALSSREDQERGIDAGANAYIVKSNFDQSNLLEVMKRLI